MVDFYRIVGSNGSPYSMKMRAVFRYRQIPHIWVVRTEAHTVELQHLRPLLMPAIRFPHDGRYRVDSTPMIYELEKLHPGQRSVIPDDPAHGFLADLIEDMADEFLTKAMFHYRWAYPESDIYASRWIAHDARPELRGDAHLAFAKQFSDRQVGRMALVGCTPENAPVIEEFYVRILQLLDGEVAMNRFLFGSRPSLADFGLFGQLKTLADDPTPMRVMRAASQRVADWVRQTDDASGIDGDWDEPGGELSSAVKGLLDLVGRIYLPFLVANARAYEAGEDQFTTELFNLPYAQGSFRYQAKCLAALRRKFTSLPDGARKDLQELLSDSRCLQYLDPDAKA